MGKFKVGDRVRCVDAEGTTCVTLNSEYVVEACNDMYVNLITDDGKTGGMYAYRFELVEQPTTWQPKVGDRVRLVKDGSSTTGAVGKLATICSWSDGRFIDDDEYLLDIDPPVDYRTLAVTPNYTRAKIDCFKPLPVAEQPAALQIVAGRYYKTRDGRKVGPMYSNGPAAPMWQWYGDNYGNFCRDDGTVHYGDNLPHNDDLIAEWVDEPAVAVAATASNDNEPAKPAKFKVGDRVRALVDWGSVKEGQVYTIPHIDEDGGVWFTSDGNGGWEDFMADDEIKLVDEPTTTDLTLSIGIDAADLHEELDEIIAKLKKIRKLQRQTGLAA